MSGAPISLLPEPIFLLGAHKSGTSLLRSLLDGYPGLFVIPTEIHFFQFTGYWIDYWYRRTLPHPMDRTALIESLCGLVAFKQEDEDEFADSIMKGKFDVEAFRQALADGDFSTAGTTYTAYVRALYRSLAGSDLPAGERIVEKSVENSENAILLDRMFPDRRFVHIVRNPYASVVAIRRARTKNGRFPYLANATLSLRNSFYHLYRNEKVLDPYPVIRYEDLLTDTEGTMRIVATALNLEFSESLLQPTVMGRPWSGNSSSRDAFRGVSTAPLEQWKSHVTHLEIDLVNRMMGPVVERFGYERLEPKRGRLLPVRGERPANYIKNRSLFWMLSS